MANIVSFLFKIALIKNPNSVCQLIIPLLACDLWDDVNTLLQLVLEKKIINDTSNKYKFIANSNDGSTNNSNRFISALLLKSDFSLLQNLVHCQILPPKWFTVTEGNHKFLPTVVMDGLGDYFIEMLPLLRDRKLKMSQLILQPILIKYILNLTGVAYQPPISLDKYNENKDLITHDIISHIPIANESLLPINDCPQDSLESTLFKFKETMLDLVILQLDQARYEGTSLISILEFIIGSMGSIETIRVLSNLLRQYDKSLKKLIMACASNGRIDLIESIEKPGPDYQSFKFGRYAKDINTLEVLKKTTGYIPTLEQLNKAIKLGDRDLVEYWLNNPSECTYQGNNSMVDGYLKSPLKDDLPLLNRILDVYTKRGKSLLADSLFYPSGFILQHYFNDQLPSLKVGPNSLPDTIQSLLDKSYYFGKVDIVEEIIKSLSNSKKVKERVEKSLEYAIKGNHVGMARWHIENIGTGMTSKQCYLCRSTEIFDLLLKGENDSIKWLPLLSKGDFIFATRNRGVLEYTHKKVFPNRQLFTFTPFLHFGKSKRFFNNPNNSYDFIVWTLVRLPKIYERSPLKYTNWIPRLVRLLKYKKYSLQQIYDLVSLKIINVDYPDNLETRQKALLKLTNTLDGLYKNNKSIYQ